MYKCFLTYPTNEASVYLRRYQFSSQADAKCPLPGEYHNELIYLGDFSITHLPEDCWSGPNDLAIPHDDPRWPTHCACGYQFQPKDEWQYFNDRIYTDGVTRWPHRQLPVGAMFFADWFPKNFYWDNKSDDHLHVITPGGTWNVDARASNCTLPNDKLHRCWVRHGDPATGPRSTLHVDKVGKTCAAGAGSIICGTYHGFLHNGSLTRGM